MSSRDDMILEAISGRRINGRGWVRANCPMCVLVAGKQDRKQCLSLNTENGKWHCFRCSSRGKLNDVPEDIEQRSRVARGDTTEPPVEVILPDGFYPLWKEPGLSAESLEPARAYLRSRDVTLEVMRAANIGACVKGKFAGRIIIPMYKGDNLVGYVGRIWTKDGELKYRYAEGMQRADILYNHEVLDVETDEPVIVVEGTFDCFPFWPDAVAVLGKPSEQQFALLAAAKRPVVVVMDGDAWREGAALAMSLSRWGVRAGHIILEPGVDPDEVPDMVRREARAAVLSEDAIRRLENMPAVA